MKCKKDILDSLCKIEVPPTTLRRGDQEMSHTYTLTQHLNWNNIFQQWKLPLYFSKSVRNHIVHFVDGMLSRGFTGTLADIHRESLHNRDRRCLSHFLTHAKWNEQHLMRIVRQTAFKQVQWNAELSNSPIFVIVGDSVCEKTKPSSQASFPMQRASYHHSHPKGKRVYGHCIVQTLLRSGDVTYPFSSYRYDPEGKSKIKLAYEMIEQVPMSKQKTYVLMDSWYPSTSILEKFKAWIPCH
jgi:hypothetical protein